MSASSQRNSVTLSVIPGEVSNDHRQILDGLSKDRDLLALRSGLELRVATPRRQRRVPGELGVDLCSRGEKACSVLIRHVPSLGPKSTLVPRSAHRTSEVTR